MKLRIRCSLLAGAAGASVMAAVLVLFGSGAWYEDALAAIAAIIIAASVFRYVQDSASREATGARD